MRPPAARSWTLVLPIVVVMVGAPPAGWLAVSHVVGTSPAATAGSEPEPAEVASVDGASPGVPFPSAYAASEAALQSREGSLVQRLLQDGAPARLLHPPSMELAGRVDGAVVPGPQYAAQLAATNVSPDYFASPAPAGIAYYGESGSDGEGAIGPPTYQTPVATVLDTSSLAGTVNVTGLNALYLDTDDPDQWGIQLNAVVTNVTLWGSDGSGPDGNSFWAQNVVGYQTFNDTLQFVENTWNFTDAGAGFATNGTAANGSSTIAARDTNNSLYGDTVYIGASRYFYAPTPFNLTLYLNLSLDNPLICSRWSSLNATPSCAHPAEAVAAYSGDQTLFYNYSLSFPTSNVRVAPGTRYAGNFDWLTFRTSRSAPEDFGVNTRSAGFEASGYATNALLLTNDYELDIGIGAFDGANQDVLNGSGTASLQYAADCTKPARDPASCRVPLQPTYRSVPAALNFGSETGETTTGVAVNYRSVGSAGIATFAAGPLNLHPLWGYGNESGVVAGEVPVTNNITLSGAPDTSSAPPYVFVFLDDTSVLAPTPWYAWAPDVPTWYLMPGNYTYGVMLSDYDPEFGTLTVSGTAANLTVTLPYDPSQGVYTPLWAVAPSGTTANAQLAGIASGGSGTLSNPYVLFHNADPAPGAALDPFFASANDYSFPSFPGLLLANTTAYVDDRAQVSFYAGTFSLGRATDALYLQQQLYETQHVTVEDSTILGWGFLRSLYGNLASQNPIPQGDLMIWNSTDDLVATNLFPAEKPVGLGYVAPTELVLYGGGASCSAPYVDPPAPPVGDPCGGNGGPAPAGSRNVVWGNTFCDAPRTSGVNVCPTAAPKATGRYAGVAEAESGDLLYNNLFDVDNPAPLMPWNLTTEVGPVFYHDTWNVSSQPASDIVETVNGVPLSGNILDNATNAPYALQGGNFWWNYGGPRSPRCGGTRTQVPGCLNSFANATYVNQFDYTEGATNLFPSPYTSNITASLLGPGDAAPLGGFAVKFRERGLPGGTVWYVNLTLPGEAAPFSLASSRTAQTVLYLPDGMYTFTISSARGRQSVPLGPVIVAGRPVTWTVYFA